MGELEARAERLLARNPTHRPNQRLLRHLTAERHHLFTFLTHEGVEATNWRAEQAIRPAVVNLDWLGLDDASAFDPKAVAGLAPSAGR